MYTGPASVHWLRVRVLSNPQRDAWHVSVEMGQYAATVNKINAQFENFLKPTCYKNTVHLGMGATHTDLILLINTEWNNVVHLDYA